VELLRVLLLHAGEDLAEAIRRDLLEALAHERLEEFVAAAGGRQCGGGGGSLEEVAP
jgi:hypothetical protein